MHDIICESGDTEVVHSSGCGEIEISTYEMWEGGPGAGDMGRINACTIAQERHGNGTGAADVGGAYRIRR